MRKMKKAVCIILIMALVLTMLPFGSMIVRAEEPGDETEALGAGYKVGDIITFGHYEQDCYDYDGMEPIEWQVLKVEENRILVISKYALDAMKYNENTYDGVWETCSLRKWLNNDFYNTAFSEKEKKYIPTVNLVNKGNTYYGTSGGGDTQDKIFCLSMDEVRTYFGDFQLYSNRYKFGYNQNLICAPTSYAWSRGACNCVINEYKFYEATWWNPITNEDDLHLCDIYSEDVLGRSGTYWWTRTPGRSYNYAASVSREGEAGDYCSPYIFDFETAVRPAMYIDIVMPNGIGLNYDSLTLQKGENRTLTATVTPEDAMDKTVTYSSSNTSVVTVDQNGNVNAVGAGNASITAKTVNGFSKTIPVNVIVKPTAIALNLESTDLFFGGGVTLTAILSPSDVTEKNITWTSSNNKVATVNNGKVTAKGAGEARITAKTVNGLIAECYVCVMADNNPNNIFADIKYDSWMYAPAKAVYDKGCMTGTGFLSGRVLFSPNTDINRTMFVQALYSMDGKSDVTYVQKFSDVKESAWYAKAVTWASNNGVVAGNADGTFGINGKATREQLALMFYKYALSKGFDVAVKPTTTLDGFTDANKVDSWALTAVKWAVEKGIISGKGNASAGYRIDPIGKATRIECAAMMNKFSEIYASTPKMGEDLEEPLALPEEEIEDVPVPADETEDVIIDEEEDSEDEDVPSEDEADMNEEEINSEEDSEVD